MAEVSRAQRIEQVIRTYSQACKPAMIAATLMLLGCAPSPSQPKEEADDALAQDQRLLADPATARPELLRRLRAAVSKRDGLVFVQSPLSLTTALLPASTPWVLLCGSGISVHFGSVVAEHDGRTAVADALNVPLVFAFVSKETCAELTLAIGKEILTIVSGG
jgi:hypothetical protein